MVILTNHWILDFVWNIINFQLQQSTFLTKTMVGLRFKHHLLHLYLFAWFLQSTLGVNCWTPWIVQNGKSQPKGSAFFLSRSCGACLLTKTFIEFCESFLCFFWETHHGVWVGTMCYTIPCLFSQYESIPNVLYHLQLRTKISPSTNPNFFYGFWLFRCNRQVERWKMVRFSGDYVKKLQGVDHIEWRFFSVLTVGKDKFSQHLKLRWWDNVLVVKVASYHPRVLRRLALPPLIILPLMELPWWEQLIRRWERLELRFGVGWCDGNASCVSQHATLFNPYSRQERWLDHGFALVGKHSSEATRGVHACGNIHQPPLFF